VETLGDLRHILVDGAFYPSTVMGFDAAFAKLLWPFVFFRRVLST